MLTAALAALALGVPVSHAQLPAPPATTEDALRQMFDQAGVIFTGQVTAIRRIASTNGSTGVLEIDFAVDDAILAATPNTTYTLREWAGISPAPASQLAVPQFEIARRYLMLLHTPGPSGLSSPVGGPDGAIPILPTAEPASPTTPDSAGLATQAALAQSLQPNTISPSPAHTTFRLGPAASPEPATIGCPTSRRDVGCSVAFAQLANSSIDLRWIATRILAPLAYAPASPAEAHPITTRANAVLPSPATPLSADLQPATQSAAYATILTLLRSWQAQSHAAR